MCVLHIIAPHDFEIKDVLKSLLVVFLYITWIMI